MAITMIKLFKVGDMAEIIANENGHEFDIGEIVKIIEIKSINVMKVQNQSGEWWHVDIIEIRKINDELKSE